MKIACSLLLIMLVSACSTQVPTAIRKIPAANISVQQVRMDLPRFSGAEVRWGGVISKVENKATRTWIEIVSLQLSKNGEPLSDSKSDGRFIASFPGFVDPVVYEVGASLTVVGSIEGQSVGLIGEYAYTFPVVLVSASYLWPAKEQALRYEYYPSPWGYYDPWPYYRHPYPTHRW